MKLPTDLPVHSETLLAVVLGAILATLSGIVATAWEARIRRRERERDGALFFGDLLSTLNVLIGLAMETQGRGEPYGPITLRMLRATRREIDLYDRNREMLYDLRDGRLRVKIHALMVRLAMPLDGVLDASDVLAADGGDTAPTLQAVRKARDQGFQFFAALQPEIAPLIAALAIPARHTFDDYGPTTLGPRRLPGVRATLDSD
ncbi:MAG: hypothetical protein ABI056_00340 [Caulobacteraceae bacterium]